jgi:hypothetical protein
MVEVSILIAVFSITDWGIGIVIGLALIALLLFVGRKFGHRPSATSIHDEELTFDLAQVKVGGPPDQGPRLEYYGTPVRLAVLVLAPSGRGTQVPDPSRLRGVVELLIPGLSEVLDFHQPVFRRWPEQLSAQGFAHAFSTHVELPGDNGKGTPWCSVAGRFDIGEGHLLAGLVCKAAKPNSLGQMVVQHEGLWHDVLRVRKASD